MNQYWILPAALALSACSNGPTDEDYDDVAAGIGGLVASPDNGGEVGSISDSLEASSGEVPTGLTLMAEGELRGERGGLSYSYSLTCLDESGDTLPSCGASTDAARLSVEWMGSVEWPRYRASISRTGAFTLRDLQSDVAVLDGAGSFDVSAELMALLRTDTRSVHLAYAAEYDALRIRRSDHAILEGAVRYEIHAERTRTTERRDVQAEFDIEGELTFDGDGTASLVLDGSRNYHVDLRTGVVGAGE